MFRIYRYQKMMIYQQSQCYSYTLDTESMYRFDYTVHPYIATCSYCYIYTTLSLFWPIKLQYSRIIIIISLRAPKFPLPCIVCLHAEPSLKLHLLPRVVHLLFDPHRHDTLLELQRYIGFAIYRLASYPGREPGYKARYR